MPPPEQPPIGGFCDDCGHFAGRHGPDGCTFERGAPAPPCDCQAMLWRGVRWPRPWLPGPAGLAATDGAPSMSALPSAEHWTAPNVDGSAAKCPGLCPRYVSASSDFCCSGCREQSHDRCEPGVLAHGDHPVLSHSAGCDERDASRRPGAWSGVG